MQVHRLVVFSEATEGREDEYNQWYNEVHLKDVLSVEGFVAAQRFELSPAQLSDASAAPARFLAIYEIEAESLEAALAKLQAGAERMDMSDAIDLSRSEAFAYSAICDRLSS